MSNEEPENVDFIETQETSPIDEKTQKNYSIWKKNAPFLYDYVFTSSLIWPSTTVQFLPDLEKLVTNADTSFTPKNKDSAENDLVYQRLLIGSFTLGMGIDTVSIYQLPYYRNLNKNLTIDKLNFNPRKEEFELNNVSKLSTNQLQKINHKGDVNRLKYMPQNPDVIASANNLGDLVIYDRTKHSNVFNSINTDINEPQLRLVNSKNSVSDIFALDWNKQKEGVIVSGNMSGDINVHDIKRDFISKESTKISTCSNYSNKNIGINDIEWEPNHDSLFYCVDDEGFIKLYDTRLDTNESNVISHNESPYGINSLSINPKNSKCIATANVEGKTSIWDIRNFGTYKNEPLYNIQSHQDSITQLKWHPNFHNVLGSSSTDRLVKIFNISNINDENSGLFFTHSGHMLGVYDFDWSLHDECMIASVSDDNSFHVWKPCQNIVQNFKSI